MSKYKKANIDPSKFDFDNPPPARDGDGNEISESNVVAIYDDEISNSTALESEPSKELVVSENVKDEETSLVGELIQTHEVPNQQQDLVAYIAQQFNRGIICNFRAGLGLIRLKEICSHGDFSEAVGKLGIPTRTCQKRMQMTQFILEQEPKVRQKLLNFRGQEQLLILARNTQEEMEALAESGELDQMARLSKADLSKKIKLKNARIDNLEQSNEALKEQLEKRAVSSEWSEESMRIREEAMIAGMEITKNMDVIEGLMHHITGKEFANNAVSGERLEVEQTAAVMHIYQAMAGAAVRMKTLLANYDKFDLPHYAASDLVEVFAGENLDDVSVLWRERVTKIKAETTLRDMLRKNKARKGKPGRPVGSKKKK